MPFFRSVLAAGLLFEAVLLAQNPPAAISVDVNANCHTINPNIYGVAYGDATTLADLNSPLNLARTTGFLRALAIPAAPLASAATPSSQRASPPAGTTNFVRIGQVGQNISTYNDMPGCGVYLYRMQAFNVAAKAVSAYSNQVQIRVK